MTNDNKLIQETRSAFDDFLDQAPLAPEWERASGQIVPLTRSGRRRGPIAALVAMGAVLAVGIGLLMVVGGPLNEQASSDNTSENTPGVTQTAVVPATTVPVSESETTVAAPVSDTEPVEITHLVSAATASSTLAGHDVLGLLDGDLDRGWKDAGLGGVDAELRFEFDVPVTIDHVVIHPLRDEDRFLRNFWIQDLEVSTQDDGSPVEVRLERVNEPHAVGLVSAATTTLRLRVLTTYPARPVNDRPPFNELAIAEIQIFGHPVDDSPSPEVATTTTIVASQGAALPTTPGDLPFDARADADWTWDWAEQVASIEAGEGDRLNDLDGVRQKLARVQEMVPDIGAATGLMYRSTEWYEDAFFLLGDGSDTMVYIGWNELESTNPISADSWKELNSQGIDPVGIVLPLLDTSMDQGTTDDVLVLMRMTDRAADFVADTATIVATVRFFQLADSYAALPIQQRSDDMGRITDAVFAALDLPKGEPGELGPPISTTVVPRVDIATLVTGSAQGERLPTVVVCAPDHPPIGDRSGDGVGYETPIAALAGFLDGARQGADYLPFPRSDYTELHLPDGSIAFVHPFDDDPALAVAWIAVAESPTGWTVDAWKSAGC